MKLDVQRLRVDVDKRARNGFYTLMKQQGPLSLQPSTADAIINDFIHHTDNKEYGPLVQSLAKSALRFQGLLALRQLTRRRVQPHH